MTMEKQAQYEALYEQFNPRDFTQEVKDKLYAIPEVKELIDSLLTPEEWNAVKIGFWNHIPFYDEFKRAIYYPAYYEGKILGTTKNETKQYYESAQGYFKELTKDIPQEYLTKNIDEYLDEYLDMVHASELTEQEMRMILHEISHYADHLKRGEQFIEETTHYYKDPEKKVIDMDKYFLSPAEQQSFLTEIRYMRSKGKDDAYILDRMKMEYGGKDEYWKEIISRLERTASLKKQSDLVQDIKNSRDLTETMHLVEQLEGKYIVDEFGGIWYVRRVLNSITRQLELKSVDSDTVRSGARVDDFVSVVPSEISPKTREWEERWHKKSVREIREGDTIEVTESGEYTVPATLTSQPKRVHIEKGTRGIVEERPSYMESYGMMVVMRILGDENIYYIPGGSYKLIISEKDKTRRWEERWHKRSDIRFDIEYAPFYDSKLQNATDYPADDDRIIASVSGGSYTVDIWVHTFGEGEDGWFEPSVREGAQEGFDGVDTMDQAIEYAKQIITELIEESPPSEETRKWEERWHKRSSLNKKAFWSVWDIQTGQYMATGSDSPTLRQAVEDCFDYLISGPEFENMEEPDPEQMTWQEKKKFCEDYEFEFHKHTEKMMPSDEALEAEEKREEQERQERLKKEEKIERWQERWHKRSSLIKKAAVCEYCHRDMFVTDTCNFPSVKMDIDKKWYVRVVNDSGKCHDCNAGLGKLHHPGCDVERCPRCGGQQITCPCDPMQLSITRNIDFLNKGLKEKEKKTEEWEERWHKRSSLTKRGISVDELNHWWAGLAFEDIEKISNFILFGLSEEDTTRVLEEAEQWWDSLSAEAMLSHYNELTGEGETLEAGFKNGDKVKVSPGEYYVTKFTVRLEEKDWNIVNVGMVFQGVIYTDYGEYTEREPFEKEYGVRVGDEIYLVPESKMQLVGSAIAEKTRQWEERWRKRSSLIEAKTKKTKEPKMKYPYILFSYDPEDIQKSDFEYYMDEGLSDFMEHYDEDEEILEIWEKYKDKPTQQFWKALKNFKTEDYHGKDYTLEEAINKWVYEDYDRCQMAWDDEKANFEHEFAEFLKRNEGWYHFIAKDGEIFTASDSEGFFKIFESREGFDNLKITQINPTTLEVDYNRRSETVTIIPEQYEDLAYAGDYLGIPGLRDGDTEIWFANTIVGPKEIDIDDLKKTHIRLGKIDETNLKKIRRLMQYKVWSPDGEGKSLLEYYEIKHGSLQEGDVVITDSVYYVTKDGFIDLAMQPSGERKMRFEQRKNLAVTSKDPAILEKLSKDSDVDIRLYVARNVDTPVQVLQVMTDDPEEAVRHGVALNGVSTPEILSKLSTDVSPYVRQKIAGHLNTPVNILMNLAKDTDDGVRQAIISRDESAIPSQVLRILVNDADPNIANKAKQIWNRTRPPIPSEETQQWEERWHRRAAFKNLTLQTSDVPESLVSQIRKIQEGIPRDILVDTEDD